MNFGQRIEEIIDELERPDLIEQARRLYLEAIQGYKDTRFPVELNRTLTFTDTDFSTYYAELPTDFAWAQQVVLEYGNVRVPLKFTSHERLMEFAGEITPQAGYPTWYALRGREIAIWPVLQAGATIRVYCLSNLAPPVADEDDSFWTSEGGLLVKYKTKALLFANVLMDPQMAQVQLVLAEGSPDRMGGELLRLKGVVDRQALSGSVDPYLGGSDLGMLLT
jgi:hypothetical protein